MFVIFITFFVSLGAEGGNFSLSINMLHMDESVLPCVDHSPTVPSVLDGQETAAVSAENLPDVHSVEVEQPSSVLDGQETAAVSAENLPDVRSVEVEQPSSVLDGQGVQFNTESNKVVEAAGTSSTTDVSNVLTCSRFYSSSNCQRISRTRKTVPVNAPVYKRSQRKTTKPARYQ